ncbi:hypothetical protein BU24DRAFT_417262, partial [Aaosphaeria arxii CBS 175.79]
MAGAGDGSLYRRWKMGRCRCVVWVGVATLDYGLISSVSVLLLAYLQTPSRVQNCLLES